MDGCIVTGSGGWGVPAFVGGIILEGAVCSLDSLQLWGCCVRFGAVRHPGRTMRPHFHLASKPPLMQSPWWSLLDPGCYSESTQPALCDLRVPAHRAPFKDDVLPKPEPRMQHSEMREEWECFCTKSNHTQWCRKWGGGWKALNSKMTKVSHSLSVIALHVSGLNSPNKTQRLAEWTKTHDLTICCLHETHLRSNDTNINRMEKDGQRYSVQAVTERAQGWPCCGKLQTKKDCKDKGH